MLIGSNSHKGASIECYFGSRGTTKHGVRWSGFYYVTLDYLFSSGEKWGERGGKCRASNGGVRSMALEIVHELAVRDLQFCEVCFSKRTAGNNREALPFNKFHR